MNMKNKLLSVLEGTLSQTCRSFIWWPLTKAFCSAAPWIQVSSGISFWALLEPQSDWYELWKYFSLSLDDWLEIVRNVSHLLSVESMLSTYCISAEFLSGQGELVSQNKWEETDYCLLMVMWGITEKKNHKVKNMCSVTLHLNHPMSCSDKLWIIKPKFKILQECTGFLLEFLMDSITGPNRNPNKVILNKLRIYFNYHLILKSSIILR